MNDIRRRDAARSRQALLSAAADLFAERGYAGTAIRSVGDRAGVDPALIARYFGGKEGLYRAVLASDPLIETAAHGPAVRAVAPATRAGAAPGRPPNDAPTSTDADNSDNSVPALVRRALDRWTSVGVSAAAQNVFRREIDDAAREATRERLDTGVLAKFRAAADVADPELAAELAVALLFGVGVARDAGTLPRLSAARSEDLVDPLIAALTAALRTPEA